MVKILICFNLNPIKVSRLMNLAKGDIYPPGK